MLRITRPVPDGERIEGQVRVRAFREEFFRRSPRAHFEAEEIFGAVAEKSSYVKGCG